MRRYAAVLAVVAGLALTGCGGTPSASPEPSLESTVAGSDEPTRRSSPSPEPDGPRTGAVQDAVQDLSRRLGVDPSEIDVVSADEVTWRDGSIGCPRPGMMYPQVLTNGSRVVLEVDGERYEYHAGGRRSAFLCENPEPPARP